jgi:hypothetical protein
VEKKNKDETKCKYCGEDTVALFETGRSRICRNPKCPADKGADWVDDDPTPVGGFTMRDPTEEEKKKFELELEILELDLPSD